MWAVQTEQTGIHVYNGLRVVRMQQGQYPGSQPTQILHPQYEGLRPAPPIPPKPLREGAARWVVDQIVPGWFIIHFAEKLREATEDQPLRFTLEQHADIRVFYNQFFSMPGRVSKAGACSSG